MKRFSKFGISFLFALIAFGCVFSPPTVMADDVARVRTEIRQFFQGVFGGQVQGAGATNGQALVWQASTSKWVPGSVSGSDTPWSVNHDAAGFNLTGAGLVSVGNGTAGAPSLTFSSDTVTGLYRVAANTLGVTANSALAMHVSPTEVRVASGSMLQLNGTGGLVGLIHSGTNTDISLYAPGATDNLRAITGGAAMRNRTTLLGGDHKAGYVDLFSYNDGGHQSFQAQLDSGTFAFYAGSGSPESVVKAPIGAIFARSDGGASTTLYVKQSGTGITGWNAVGTVGAPSLPVVRVRRTAAQTLTNSTNTDLIWDTEQLDTDNLSAVGAGSTSDALVTTGSGEVYTAFAGVSTTAALGIPSIVIKLIDTDGTTTLQRGAWRFPTGSTDFMAPSTVLVSTAANQKIRVHVGHTSSGDATTSDSVNGDVSCSIVRVR